MGNTKRPSYQAELRRRLDEQIGTLADSEPALFEFVKDVALESFKNGVGVGKRRVALTALGNPLL